MIIQYVSVGILVNDKQEILMEKNASSEKYKGLWQFPGGKIIPNEKPCDALYREIKEELGVDLKFDDIKPAGFIEYDLNDTHHYVVMFYICNKWNGNVGEIEGQEIAWVSLKELRLLPKLPYNQAIIERIHSLI